MTKTKFWRILVLTLVFASLLCCIVACDQGGGSAKYNVTYMDGTNQLGSAALDPGSVISPIPPSKEGFSFVGWYKDAEFNDPFVAGTTIESDLTLYAKFVAKSAYLMVDNANGSDLGKIPVTPEKPYALEKPVKEGHTFVNYTYYDDDGKEQIFALAGIYKFSGSIRITAKWDIQSFIVNLVDGETYANPSVEYGGKVTLTQPTKDGYTFLGWYDEEDQKFDANTPITKDMTLTAKYQANSYKVTINSKGGSTVDVQTLTYGESYTLPTPTKTGYDFAGYEQMDETIFMVQGTYMLTKDITLVATWTLQSYSVTFDLDGSTVQTQTIKYGEFATLPDAAAGYEYVAYTDAEKTQAVDLATTAIDGEKTFYLAKNAKTFTITVEGLPKGENTFTATYNDTYTLPETPTKEGYTFNKYTFSVDDFAYTGTYTWTEDITVIADFAVDPLYNKIVITLKDGSDTITTKTVDKNATTVTLTDVNTAKTGYTFDGWYTDAGLQTPYVDGEITFTEYIDLYAKYTLNSWTITIDEKGGDDVNNVPVDYNGSYTLPDLTKKGYTFAGYKYGANTFAKTGTYSYDKDITVEAQWTRNEITVVFMNGDAQHDSKEIYQYQTITDANVTTPTKIGYTFSKWQIVDTSVVTHQAYVDFANDAEISANITFYALFTANDYTITLDFGDSVTEEIDVTYGATYTLPVTPIKAGYVFVKYQYDSADFAQTGTYAVDDDITVTIVWDVDTSVGVLEQDGYFKERSLNTDPFTYVFLIGNSYDFSTNYSKVEEINASESAMFYTDGNTKFTPAKVGTFTLKLTPKDGEVYERSAKVVYDIYSLGMGGNYNGMTTNATNSELYKTTNSDVVLDVGQNNFKPEIAILKDQTNAISMTEAEVVVTAKDSTSADVSSLVTLSVDSITFDSSLIDQEIELTFAPKYLLATSNITKPTLKVKVNDGVNVHTSDELRTAYADASVHKINILRTIKAELSANDYISGHGKNITNVTLKNEYGANVTLENVDTGAPVNYFTNSVYARKVNDVNDNLVINGNYFEINGSALPYIDNRYDHYGAGGNPFTSGDSYIINNVQVGLFLYICGDETVNSRERYVTGHVDFNNISITGNNIPGYSGYTEDVGNALPLLKMSSSYIGVVNRGGTINMDNVIISNVSLGFMGAGNDNPGESQTVAINLANCKIKNAWANNIYLYDLCKINLKNTDLGVSCGPSISVDDVAQASSCTLNTTIILDKYTASHINNWVTGNEAWFAAYGTTQLAAQVKSTAEDRLAKQSGNTMTLLKTIVGAGECINLGIMVRSGGNYKTSQWEADKDKKPTIDLQVYPTSGVNFFYGEGELDAAVALNNVPYLEVSTAELGAEYNDVIKVYLPAYNK